MIACKAFEPGLICRGYQFVMGLNVTDKANCRANGFHCAENPLDCLNYYADMSKAEYYLVNAGGDLDEDDGDTKIACTQLNIIKMLTRKEFFLFSLAYMVDHPFHEINSHVKKDCAQAADGYAIVCGIDPVACGQLGDILAFAKADPVTGKIKQISMAQVDGEKILPDVWYGVDLTERTVCIA